MGITVETTATFIELAKKCFQNNQVANIALEKDGKFVKTFTLLQDSEMVRIQGGANKISLELAAKTFLETATKNNVNLLFV